MPVLCAFDRAYVPESGRVHHEALSVYYKRIIYVPSIEELEVEANKYTIYAARNDSKELFDAVFEPAFSDRLDVACAGVEWIDFMNKGVNKGEGLRHLCQVLGIAIADAAAVGDTYNDTEMLEAAGHRLHRRKRHARHGGARGLPHPQQQRSRRGGAHRRHPRRQAGAALERWRPTRVVAQRRRRRRRAAPAGATPWSCRSSR